MAKNTSIKKMVSKYFPLQDPPNAFPLPLILTPQSLLPPKLLFYPYYYYYYHSRCCCPPIELTMRDPQPSNIKMFWRGDHDQNPAPYTCNTDIYVGSWCKYPM